ncbi:MAG: FAD-dependent oxidoreductase [Acidaminococcaceae bacterium]|nr:FAD-dependent oxidoreductase [Acidaminococcaceae bacterium]MDD4721277.1 FAD-dependent oxidoreductase [Acidaminococcaceae bacterium]
MFDVAIIGGGPAGLSAAVTASVRNKKVAIFDSSDFSPHLRKASKVYNYLGLPDISGEELMNKFVAHAMSFTPEVIKNKVIGITQGEESFTIGTAGDIYEAKTIILAMGVSHSDTMNGERDFLGKGVSYCATCDGYFYKGKVVAAVSTVPSALEEVEYLAELCSEVKFLPLYKLTQVPKHSNITVVSDKPTGITGTERVTGLSTTGEYLPVQGVFIFRETDPIENLLPDLQLRGKSILVDEQMSTNVDGIFAAGDCTGQPYQISRATGQGLTAAWSAVSYLAKKAK